jgi:hypothetical protein
VRRAPGTGARPLGQDPETAFDDVPRLIPVSVRITGTEATPAEREEAIRAAKYVVRALTSYLHTPRPLWHGELVTVLGLRVTDRA